MSSKPFSQIVTDMRNYISYKDPTIDTEIGSITRDVVIDPVANEAQGIYTENERVGYIHSFFYYNFMTDDELDALAYNYGLTRKPAVPSTGTATFRKNTAVTTDILIPLGTVISTQKTINESAINFVTTEEKTMLASLSASYFNSITGYYEIDVSIQAQDSGEAGNVSANSIKVIQSAVPGINSVINKVATSGGTEKESNKDFSARGLLALTGNNVGTESGYLSTVLSNLYVYDALLIGPGDPLMTRDGGLGGKVDIYISANLANANTYTTQEETYTYTDLSGRSGATSILNDKILVKQPVRSVISIVGSVSGTFVEGVDYELQITATSNTYYGSILAVDKIHWLLNTPQSGETITINYYYYILLQDLTDLIETKRAVTADVLVKLAIPIAINASATVYADSTITAEGKDTFMNSVISEITTFIDSTSLSRRIQQSDIIQVMYNATGTDRIAIPLSALNAPAIPAYATGVHDEIILIAQQYSTAGTISVSVILVS